MDERLRNASFASYIRRTEKSGKCLVALTEAQRGQFERAVKAGLMVKPMRKLYARAEYWVLLSPQEQALHCMRSLQQMHAEWVYLGPSAALAHGLEVPESSLWPICVAAERNKGRYNTPIISKRFCDDTRQVLIDRMRASTLERTVLDSLSELGFCDGLAMADSALRVYGISRDELAKRVESLCGFSDAGQQVLKTLAYADGRARNGVESRARGLAIELGFEPPIANADGNGALGWQRGDQLVLMPVQHEIADHGAFAAELDKLGVPRVMEAATGDPGASPDELLPAVALFANRVQKNSPLCPWRLQVKH